MRLSVPIYQLKRQAKLRSRQDGVSLSEALNRAAKNEGFESWGLLASHYAERRPAEKILNALSAGDLVLLGARPGHGKTLMGLELIIEALKSERHAAFYSLECTENDVVERLTALGAKGMAANDLLKLDTSDRICADYIIEQLGNAPRGSIVVIDYLQLLDQNRTMPALSPQVSALKTFAESVGIIVVMLSQIDRSYDPVAKPLPDVTDVRLPNALDLNLFTKTVFMNDGAANLQAVS
jgi:replicative DNA helicase